MGAYVTDDEWGTKYPHFTKDEFKCPCCGSVGVGIATSLLETMERLRDEYGSIIITSGYRCPSYNAQVGGVSYSAHMKGQAADFVPTSGITNNQDSRIAIVNEIKTFPNYHYAYCNVNGDYPNMGNAIHVDTILTGDEPTTGEYYYISADGEGLWLLNDSGNRVQAYADGTIVEYLGEEKNRRGYNYMKVRVTTDNAIGYMAKDYLVKKENNVEPTPEPEPIPSDDETTKELEEQINELNNVIAMKDKQIKELIEKLEELSAEPVCKDEFLIDSDNQYRVKIKKGETLLVIPNKDSEYTINLFKEDIVRIK